MQHDCSRCSICRVFLPTLILLCLAFSSRSQQQKAGLFSPPRQVVSGDDHTCVLFQNGGVKCWGNNYHGNLGLGDTASRGGSLLDMGSNLSFVDLGTNSTGQPLTASSISLLAASTCVTIMTGGGKSSRRVKCWGWNFYGTLGLGDSSNRGVGPRDMGNNLPFVDLGAESSSSAGAQPWSVEQISIKYHACAVLGNGRVKCWGENDEGKLGIGDTLARGVSPSHMGDSLPFVDLGTGMAARQVCTGDGHSCALLANGRIKCWGGNYFGTLGLGDRISRGNLPGTMGDNLPFVDLGTTASGGGQVLNASLVRCGTFFSCALLTDGRAKCWGVNDDGYLGLGDTQHRGDDPGEMGNNLPYVDLGTMPDNAALDLALDGTYACAVLQNGRVKCWGDNMWGRLGSTPIQPYPLSLTGDEPNEMGSNLPYVNFGNADAAVSSLAAGFSTACATLADEFASIKCWGNNMNGLLGQGISYDRLAMEWDPSKLGPVNLQPLPPPPTTQEGTSSQASWSQPASQCAPAWNIAMKREKTPHAASLAGLFFFLRGSH